MAAFLEGRPRPEGPLPVGPPDLQVPFEGDVSAADRFSNYARSYSIMDSDLPQIIDAARDVAERLVFALEAGPASCSSAEVDFASCVREVIAERGPIVLRRPLSSDEVSTLQRIATDNVPLLGRREAFILALQALLASPEVVFRKELGRAGASADLRRLDPFEIASALALTITDAPADTALWAAAAEGRLSTPAQVAEAVRRLTTPLTAREPIVRFFREFFGYHRAHEVFKDPDESPHHQPELLTDDSELTTRDLLETHGHRGLLQALLTSPSGYARKKTQASYGLKSLPDSPTRVVFPAAQRFGLLTQPSFLSALSASNHTDPVKRGRFIAESLLCQTIPELPIDAIPDLPDPGLNATMRQRLAQHVQPSCVTCHQLMDPLGLGLEAYDHTGRYRTTEAGKPVDVRGALTGAGEQDGAFVGASELMPRLAASSTVERCFVRHAFRYWMGREETPADGCTLAAALAAFQRHDGDYGALLAALFTAPAFLDRVVTP